jgi:hypothetical protein
MLVDRVHGPVDHDRAVVYESTVDHGRRWPKGSLELTLGAAPVSGSSPAVGEKEKGAPGVPTVGEGGRCGAGGEWDMTLMLGVGRLWARISGARWGKMLQVKWPWVRAPFIASGRRGEGLEEATNRRRWKFNTGRF